MTTHKFAGAAHHADADAALTASFGDDAFEPNARIRTLYLDDNTQIGVNQQIGPVDRIVLGSGRDDSTPTSHSYFIQLNNKDFTHDTPFLIVDGSALAAGSGDLFDETALISTQFVKNYNAQITLGAAGDVVVSGQGSDTIDGGAGNDYISIGTGNDSVIGGDGDDYVDSTAGDWTAGDAFDGGAGNDELSLYTLSVTDAAFADVHSVEVLGLSSGGDLVMDANAYAAGIQTLYVDSSGHHITVGAGFHGPVTFYSQGSAESGNSIDASQSDATITLHAEYDAANTLVEVHGGTGANDTVYLSSGFQFDGAPVYGGDLSLSTGVENVIVAWQNGGAGATVTLATKAGSIDAKFQTVDASSFQGADALTLDAHKASASIHVIAGTGADTLVLGKGSDVIFGGGAADSITTGGGKDTLVYTARSDSNLSAVDTVNDFVSGKDHFDVTGLGADRSQLSGDKISFFGNQTGAAGDNAAFAKTAGDGVLDAVYRTDSHTLWFDTNDNGVLDRADLHVVLTGVDQLTGTDVMSGHLVV